MRENNLPVKKKENKSNQTEIWNGNIKAGKHNENW